MLPGFISKTYSLTDTNSVFTAKYQPSSSRIIPMDIDTCYEDCKRMHCYCWERPEGGCEPGTEMCNRSALRSCNKRCFERYIE